MKIFCESLEEYIAMSIAVCGEVEKDVVLARAPGLASSASRALKNLRDARVINKHRYDDKRTFLRLSSVGAGDYLGSLSPALLGQAMSVTSPDLSYSGSKVSRLRERCNYELYDSFFSEGIKINSLLVEYRVKDAMFSRRLSPAETEGRSIFEGSVPKSIDEIAGEIDENYIGLLTKKVIKKAVDGEVVRDTTKGARMAGTFICNKQAYQIYAFKSAEGSSWKPESEFAAANYVTGAIERNSKYYSEGNIKLIAQCILFFSSPEEACAMIRNSADSRLRIDPCRIYEISYVRPTLGIDKKLLGLLKITGWRYKLVKVLFPDVIQDSYGDNILPDGSTVYNFIGCDLNGIRKNEVRIKNSTAKSILLVEDWMKDAITDKYSDACTDIVTLSGNDISLITDSIS